MTAALAALPLLGHAAGLGKLTVVSALGQPLRAELDITASREELASLTARVAPPEAFRQANIEYAGILSNVRLTLERRSNGQPYFRVSSDRVISDPFLDMLVELNWSSGRLVREYTFLLDPPEMAKAPEAPAPVTAPTVAPAQEPVAAAAPSATEKPSKGSKRAPADAKRRPRVAAAETETEAKPKPAAEPVAKAEPAESGDTRAVRKGDTLGKIASEMRPEGASLEQTLVALFRQNKSAFEGSNMNRLKAGKILSLPDKDAVAAVDAAEARKVVVAQSADFEAYKRKLAGAVAAAPAAKEAPAQQASGGKIAPKVEDKAPAATGKDKLQVSRTEGGSAKAEEDRVAKEKALKDAQGRVAELEKNVADMRKLLELKNQAAADLQKQAAKQPEAKKPEAPVPAKPVEPPKATEAAKPAEAPKPAETKPAEPPKAAEAAKAPEADKSAEQKPAEEKPAAPPAPPKPKKPVVIPEPEPEPSFIEDNLPLVAGGGGVLALLLGYLGFKSFKRRKDAKAAEAATDSALSSSSVLDLSSSEAFSQVEGAPSEFGDIGTGTFGTGEGVDPVREAETFMAYGRDAQAEEILVDALRKDAGNLPVYLKLLEIYAARKSVFQFNAIAQDLHGQTQGMGPEWEKAAAMGRAVDPNNALYQDNAAAVAEPAPAPEAEPIVEATAEPAAPDLDFNLDLETPAETAATPAPEAAADIAFEPVAPAPEPESPEPEPVPEPAPAADEVASLDFDLGLAESAPAAAPAEAAPQPQVAEAAVEAAPDADFDLDFDLGSTEAPAAEPVAEAPAAPAVDMANMLDFDLDLGAPVEPAAPSAPSAPSAPVSSDMGALDIDFDLSGDTATAGAALPDLPLDEAPAPAAAAEAAPAEAPALDFDFDLGNVDLPLTETPTDMAPPLDLSGIDLDLAATEAEAPAAPAADEPENPEAATKLELAQAYEEMGDREGAKELFQEVLAEGNASQQAAAREKLALLG